MQTRVLLSIKPKFAEAIFAGTKKFEFRRAIFKNPQITHVLVYASSPVSKVLGEFEVDGVLNMTIKNLWDRTSSWAGIDQSYFKEYFRGKRSGYALKVKKPIKFSEPLSLQGHFGISHPPQSFCYVDDRTKVTLSSGL
jgi:predicted transcriptional regulator